VLGVWHLLVFINQRHFVIALGILLSFVYVCHCLEGKSKKSQLYWALFFGILIGVFPVFHKAALLIFAVVMVVYFLLLPFSRLFLFATGAISILVMGLLWLLSFNPFGAASGVGWYPGFMIHGSLSFVNAVKFFWYQFGLHAVLIPVGFCLVPKRVRIFMLPAFIVLIIAFLFKFSQKEVLAGHKFFNYFLIMSQLLTAYVVVKIYDFVSAGFPRAKALSLCVTGVLVLLLTLTGVIDLFPIVNGNMTKVGDIGSNPEMRWFAENTPRDSVVLTSEFLFAPPSIAGRKIFLGYAYFTQSAGYFHRGRRKIVDAIYRGDNRDGMCRLLYLNDISYVEVSEFEPTKSRPTVNVEYFRENFSPEYVSSNGRYEVYSRAGLCE
jgi:hypothetical protein